MGVSDPVASQSDGTLIQRALAQLGAQRAGMLFLPLIEHDLRDLRLHQLIGHTQRFAEPSHRFKVHVRPAEMYGDCGQ